MTQIALPFEPAAVAAPSPFDAIGFEIGWDHAHHRLTPPADHMHGMHPVRQGWEAGRAAFGARTLKPTRHVRRWLALRLQAWLSGYAFEDVRVTPHFLAQIEPLQCPVTRMVLTHGDDAPTDAVVVRAYDGAGFAAGNLVVLSRRTAQACDGCSATDAEAVARGVAAGERAVAAGLDAAQWQRLAGLLRLAAPTPHPHIATLPLRVLPPNRLRVLNPAPALQAVLTALFTGTAYARRMADLGALMPNADARRQYFLFMNAMLARRLSVGWVADRTRVRTTLEDAWGHPVIQRRWEQLVLRLSRDDCERIVRLAAQRGLGGAGWKWLEDVDATEGWALEYAGRVSGSDTTAYDPSADPAPGKRVRSLHPIPPAPPAGAPSLLRV